MKKLNLPKDHIDAILRLAQMSDLEFDAVLKRTENLNDLKVSHSVDALFRRITKFEGDEKVLFTTIFSMLRTISNSGENDVEFWPILSFSLPDEKFDEGMKELLEKRLKEVYSNSEGIRCLMKANLLIDESEHIFYESRVLTDVRPVFQNDTPRLRGDYAVIIHKLKLVREDGDGVRDIFISMTQKQLKELKNQIERAIEKEEHLREKGQFNYLS